MYRSPLTGNEDVPCNLREECQPLIGLFDWRPKNLDEALVAAESRDCGRSWFFLQTVLELFPDPVGLCGDGSCEAPEETACPTKISETNSSDGDSGWGNAAVVQLPGIEGTEEEPGQFLYMSDRLEEENRDRQLYVIQLDQATNKFPIFNTNYAAAGHNDIKSIATALKNTPGSRSPVNARSGCRSRTRPGCFSASCRPWRQCTPWAWCIGT